MQSFCFFLGRLHFKHCPRVALDTEISVLSALWISAWICVLWSAFFFARMLILGEGLPLFVKWLLFSGMALVVFFTNPQRNILKGTGRRLGALALNDENFTDVVLM